MPLTLPSPRVIPSGSVPALRWGIVGTGIADRFVNAMHRYSTQRAVGVTARDTTKTAEFAARHGIAGVFASLDDLLADDSIDVVYIATPHPLHRDQALKVIGAGKHVLIEKPIAMSAAQAAEILTAAKSAGVLAMEAMWTRYLPQSDIIRQVIAEGTLGDLRLVTADFGFSLPFMPEHRLWNAELGGGALLDAGVYPISFASSVLGAPERVVAIGELASTGVDARADLLLAMPGNTSALLSTSLVSSLPTRASIVGSLGRIDVMSPFFGPKGLELSVGVFDETESIAWLDDGGPEHVGDGLAYQAIAFASYVADSLLESPVHPHSEIVSVMATIDEARRQVSGAGAD